jgi:hypothetical protein
MISFKGTVSCLAALVIATALYAEEKAPAQPAPAQVATAVKTPAPAQEAAAKKAPEAMPMHAMDKMCHMQCMQCGKMVASGNGVIILLGNRLLKYDANLTLVKETEIKPAADHEKMAETPKAPAAKGSDTKPAETKK